MLQYGVHCSRWQRLQSCTSKARCATAPASTPERRTLVTIAADVTIATVVHLQHHLTCTNRNLQHGCRCEVATRVRTGLDDWWTPFKFRAALNAAAAIPCSLPTESVATPGCATQTAVKGCNPGRWRQVEAPPPMVQQQERQGRCRVRGPPCQVYRMFTFTTVPFATVRRVMHAV
jgi:hypothetical protein